VALCVCAAQCNPLRGGNVTHRRQRGPKPNSRPLLPCPGRPACPPAAADGVHCALARRPHRRGQDVLRAVEPLGLLQRAQDDLLEDVVGGVDAPRTMAPATAVTRNRSRRSTRASWSGANGIEEIPLQVPTGESAPP